MRRIHIDRIRLRVRAPLDGDGARALAVAVARALPGAITPGTVVRAAERVAAVVTAPAQDTAAPGALGDPLAVRVASAIGHAMAGQGQEPR